MHTLNTHTQHFISLSCVQEMQYLVDQAKLVKERGGYVKVVCSMCVCLHCNMLACSLSTRHYVSRTGFFQSLLGTTKCKGGASCTTLPEVLRLGEEGKDEWRQGTHTHTNSHNMHNTSAARHAHTHTYFSTSLKSGVDPAMQASRILSG